MFFVCRQIRSGVALDLCTWWMSQPIEQRTLIVTYDGKHLPFFSQAADEMFSTTNGQGLINIGFRNLRFDKCSVSLDRAPNRRIWQSLDTIESIQINSRVNWTPAMSAAQLNKFPRLQRVRFEISYKKFIMHANYLDKQWLELARQSWALTVQCVDWMDDKEEKAGRDIEKMIRDWMGEFCGHGLGVLVHDHLGFDLLQNKLVPTAIVMDVEGAKPLKHPKVM
jgi:hypothetical protein